MIEKNWQDLSLKEQIAQMIVVRASGHLYDHQIRYPVWEATNDRLKKWLRELNLGGVILLGGSSVELQARSQQLQGWSKLPLFIAADVEEGIGQRFPGGTWFPPPMALSAIYEQNPDSAREYARQMGRITAREAATVGLNWLLAPVVDVNNNPNNPVINIRAFGDRSEVVADLTTAFIEGAKSAGVLTTAKHFPGHGDTATDSHLELPTILHDESRLAAVELPSFIKAIAAGVDSVMTAHLLIPAWDEQRPATLSSKIVTEQLRNRLGFTGLVVTDALIMGGITRYAPPEEVAVMAVEAGCDVLLMPDHPEVAIASIYSAVESGRISQRRIQQSWARIRRAKQKIVASEIAPVELGDRQASLTVNSILQDSMQTTPSKTISQSESGGRNLIVVDDVLNTAYLDLNSPAIAIPDRFNYQRQIVDRSTLDCMLLDSRPTLLQVFIRGNPFRGSAGLTTHAKQIYQRLVANQQLEAIVVYGSPYVWQWFQNIASDLPGVFTYGQMEEAQAIALKTLFNREFARDLDLLTSKFQGDFGF